MKPLGSEYANAKASTGEYEKLPPGGYVIKILDAVDVPEKSYIKVLFDISEGEYKGFYSDDYAKDHPGIHTLYMSYTQKALGMFKGRLKAIDESNNTNFEAQATTGLNEKQLVGKLSGALMGEEEYLADDGEIKVGSVKIRTLVPVSKIRSGDFKVPDLKKYDPTKDKYRSGNSDLPIAEPEGFTSLNDSDIPF